MKLDLPDMPDASVELRQWIERVVKLINSGFYAPKIVTAAPTLTQMSTGELALGQATGPSSEHEIFAKVSDTIIARWRHDATIT